MSKYIFPHLLHLEYRCKHCGRLPPDFYVQGTEDVSWFYLHLFGRYKIVRERWDRSINVTCGFRCPTHNKAIGGAALGAHLWGGGLDMDFATVQDTEKMERIIEELIPEVRMIVHVKDGSFIHFDIMYLAYPRVSEFWYEGFRRYQ